MTANPVQESLKKVRAQIQKLQGVHENQLSMYGAVMLYEQAEIDLTGLRFEMSKV